MKQYFIIAATLMLSNLAYSQTNLKQDSALVWVDEINEAHAISRASGKPIFAFFTGSDWCGWCKKLQKEVFAKPSFKEWASNEVVLLELDFPSRKVLPEKIVRQNQSLQGFFKVTGYPTVWLFCISEDKEKPNHFIISPLGSLGYPRDPVLGQEEVTFLENAKNIMASRTCQ